MEITPRAQQRENPSSISSPNSNGSSSSSSHNNINNGFSSIPNQIQTPPFTPKPILIPSPSSSSITRSESSNPSSSSYPTTFVQADTSTFKHVVQLLTGSSETVKQASSEPPTPTPSKTSIPPIRTSSQKKQGYKLYERRNSLKNGLMISPLMPNPGFSQRKPEILSPSILNFPSLVLSPVTPLIQDPFNKSSPSSMGGSSSEEERAIAEKKFYLHPSPRTSTPRDTEPQLLPLFPVTSPRVSGS